MTTDATSGRPRRAGFIATSLDGFIARAEALVQQSPASPYARLLRRRAAP